jgi:hypothetical protein
MQTQPIVELLVNRPSDVEMVPLGGGGGIRTVRKNSDLWRGKVRRNPHAQKHLEDEAA